MEEVVYDRAEVELMELGRTGLPPRLRVPALASCMCLHSPVSTGM